jgi:signal transduction histidine kinase
VSRRISEPVSIAADATTRLARGDHAARVPSARMGPELDALADGVNSLAERLERAEGTRIRLMSDLAHELRTPLAAIDATVEAITDGVLPSDERTLATLKDNTLRLSRLVDDLASVSRAEERSFRLELREADLAEIARRAVTSADARFAAKGVGLTGPIGRGPRATVDPDRILEVLGQLLDNALHACSQGGTVSVDVISRGSSASVTVTDTGSGFDPEEREQLFQRFYRVGSNDSTHPGSGIGLTIARSLVMAQGGTLTAATAGPGRGAAFTMTLSLV